jgi:hypothetical protein
MTFAAPEDRLARWGRHLLVSKGGAEPGPFVTTRLALLFTEDGDMVRTLLGFVLKLPHKFDVVLAAIENGNMTILDLVASSGVTVDA